MKSLPNALLWVIFCHAILSGYPFLFYFFLKYLCTWLCKPYLIYPEIAFCFSFYSALSDQKKRAVCTCYTLLTDDCTATIIFAIPFYPTQPWKHDNTMKWKLWKLAQWSSGSWNQSITEHVTANIYSSPPIVHHRTLATSFPHQCTCNILGIPFLHASPLFLQPWVPQMYVSQPQMMSRNIPSTESVQESLERRFGRVGGKIPITPSQSFQERISVRSQQ